MYTEVKRKEILELYCREMEIIKFRTEQIFAATSRFEYIQPAVEFKALQLRKIIEQILLASLITNADEYKRCYDRLEKDWNVKCISKDLERLNKDFFPVQAIDDHQNHKVEDAPESLGCKALVSTYDKLGKYLHARNPFSQELDYNSLSRQIDDMCRQIIKLLNTHTIKPYGVDAFIYVVMKSDTDGHVYALWADRYYPE